MIEDKIKEARDLLKSYGYYTDILWHIDDVRRDHKCSDGELK